MADSATNIRIELKRITKPGKGVSTDDLIDAIGATIDRLKTEVNKLKYSGDCA